MFATSNMSIAGTVGNTADTQGGFGKYSIQLENDWIFKREMIRKKVHHSGTQYSYVNPPGTYSGGTPSNVSTETESDEHFDMKSKRVFLNGTLGLHPNVDFFIKLGTADANMDSNLASAEFDGDFGFAWGLGIKAKLFETAGKFRLMGIAKYLSYEMNSRYISEGKDFSQAVDPGDSRTYNSKIKAKEWEIGLYVNQSFKQFSPYFGVNYSDSEIKNEINYNTYYSDGSLIESIERTDEFRQKDNIGIFLGTNIDVISKVLSVNIEGRFINETATTIGINYQF